ncbi:hypothetical protein KBD45_05040 [Candidatus Dojkabacteria bacterium]|nr:hypothetical protein [Candidatus Dojkabacteria bacterium]
MQYQNQIPTQNFQPNNTAIPPVSQTLQPQVTTFIEPSPINDIPRSIKIINAWLVFLMIINLGFGILKMLGLILFIILAFISKTAITPLQIIPTIIDVSLLLILFVLIKKYRKHLKLLERKAFIALVVLFGYYIFYSFLSIFFKVLTWNILDFILYILLIPASCFMLIILLLARQYFVNKTELKIVPSMITYSLISLTILSYQLFSGTYGIFNNDNVKIKLEERKPIELTEWEPYTSQEFNIQFNVPKGYKVIESEIKPASHSLSIITDTSTLPLARIVLDPSIPGDNFLSTLNGEEKIIGGQKGVFVITEFIVDYKGQYYHIVADWRLRNNKVEITENGQKFLDSITFI